MKLRFIWVGKTKRTPIKEMIGDYLGRIEHWARVELVELRDRPKSGGVEQEGAEILSRIGDEPLLVVLDERGREMDSHELALFLGKHLDGGTKRITFVVGGPNGLSGSVKKQADVLLALSRMTLTHELARVLLVEQVYRAFTIVLNLEYQK